MFCDFLMRLYDIGEVISVMALSSLFILMMRWGLECPYFYEKLLVSCLVSTLLPAYSAATFAEKLSQVALSVLPVVALVIVAPIHNFFQCLPTINCLVHGEDGVSEVKADLKIEEQIVGNRNDSTGSDLPKKLGFNLFRNASGPSKSLTPEVPSTTKIAVKIKLMFTKLWISFFRLPLPLDVYKEVSSKRIAARSLLQCPLLLLLLLLLLLWVPRAVGENGTASYYGPPYERTECYGEGSSQFPESNFFAAVGDGLWDLGAACGREYELRCIGDAQSGPGACKPGAGNVRVRVVDYALSVESSATAPRQSVTGADLVLSQAAFEAIANPSVDSIRVEFKRL